MTTHNQFLTPSPEPTANNSTVFQDTSQPIVKHHGTLRRRLLTTLLPTFLIPLLIASSLVINLTNREAQKARKEKLEAMKTSIVLTSTITDRFLQDALNVNRVLEANPFIIQALKSGIQQAQSQGLLQQPIERSEQQFATTKLLGPNSSLNDYLKTTAETNDLAEIILTEKNGFNVGYSSPTSDFVQSDEQWWQTGQKEGEKILAPEFDDSTQTAVLELVKSITDPSSGQLLGVTKIGISVPALDDNLAASIGSKMSQSQTLQIIDANSGKALNTITNEGATELGEVVGGEVVAEIAKIFSEGLQNSEESPNNILTALKGKSTISNVRLDEFQDQSTAFIENPEHKKEGVKPTKHTLLSFEQGERYFQLTNVPDTNLVAVTAIDKAEVAKAERNLMVVFASTAVLLGLAATGIIILLAQQLSKPLTDLTQKAQQVAEGNLDVRAKLQGTLETRTLADNFNTLLNRVQGLIQEQTTLAREQQQQKEKLEKEIYQLLDEVEGAVEGDLTVRANLSSMEMSTVADLFNAIIDNLKDIAIQVKESSTQVSSSLGENEQAIQQLAEQAIQEAEATRQTLTSVEQMSHSIEAVATNANQAATLADDTYIVTQEGAKAVEETVDSILNLKATVSETARKMKQLGESSQRISQVVSLIEEMTLKTNLLAINAGRSGEQGRGFAVFGEQLGLLAEQSAEATREIAQIVTEIQLETQEVSRAMELGTAQVMDSTHLVESTKQRLGQVLERSRTINDLMKSISQATVSQTDTSRTVTQLMQQIAQQSEQRLASSQQVVQSMQTTAQVAKQLESAVDQFKVDEE